ncbi:hypothetical protein BASA62_007229 [Batrachochytrium salamandrivorans]|nr:hypothetical protein BASA62_007229 [Batrachochytrium salamandrivorans]
MHQADPVVFSPTLNSHKPAKIMAQLPTSSVSATCTVGQAANSATNTDSFNNDCFVSPARSRKRLAAFGTPSSQNKSSPHIMFLIDLAGIVCDNAMEQQQTHSSDFNLSPTVNGTSSDDHTTNMNLKWNGQCSSSIDTLLLGTVLRVLTYFYVHVNPNLTWGFEIIDSSVYSQHNAWGAAPFPSSQNISSPSSPTHTARSILDLGSTAILRLESALKECIAFKLLSMRKSSETSPTPASSNIIRLIKTCRRLLVQVPWHISPTGPFQSPLKPITTKINATKDSIKSRSYLFVVSRIPLSANELAQSIDMSDPEMVSGGSMHPMLPTLLMHAKNEMVSKDLWQEFVGLRVSLSWIHPFLIETHPGGSQIRSLFAAVTRSYGGSLTIFPGLLNDRLRHSIPESMQLLHPRTVETAFAKQLINAKTPSSLLASLECPLIPIGSLKYPMLSQTQILYHNQDCCVGPIHLQIADIKPKSTAKCTTTSPFDAMSSSMTEVRMVPLHQLDDSIFSKRAFFCMGSLNLGSKPASTSPPTLPLKNNDGKTFDQIGLGAEQLIAFLEQYSAGLVVTLRMRIEFESLDSTTLHSTQELDNPFESSKSSKTTRSEEIVDEAVDGFEIRTAVLIPLVSSVFTMHIVRREQEHALHLTPVATLNDFANSAYAASVVDGWLHPKHPSMLSDFLNRNSWVYGDAKELGHLFFDLWSPNMISDTPRKRQSAIKTSLSPVPDEVSPEKPHLHDVAFEGTPTISEALSKLLSCYYDVIFEKTMLSQFVGDQLPCIYNALIEAVDSSTSKDMDAIVVLLDFYRERLILPIQAQEVRHRTLAKLIADAFERQREVPAVDVTGMCAEELNSARLWVERIREQLTSEQRQDSKYLRSEIGRQARRLRTNEALLQMTLWMECLRIHTDTGHPLSEMKLSVQQKTKVDKPKKGSTRLNAESTDELMHVVSPDQIRAGIVQAISEQMDRVCIWSVLGNVSGIGEPVTAPVERCGSPLWHKFVSPVAIMFYQEQLPDVVELLVTKVGGDATEQTAPIEPMSPFFKKLAVLSESARSRVASRPSESRPNSEKNSRLRKRPSLMDMFKDVQQESVDQEASDGAERSVRGHRFRPRPEIMAETTTGVATTKSSRMATLADRQTRQVLRDMSRRQIQVQSTVRRSATTSRRQVASAEQVNSNGSCAVKGRTERAVMRSTVSLDDFLGKRPQIETRPVVAGVEAAQKTVTALSAGSSSGPLPGTRQQTPGCITLVPVTPVSKRKTSGWQHQRLYSEERAAVKDMTCSISASRLAPNRPNLFGSSSASGWGSTASPQQIAATPLAADKQLGRGVVGSSSSSSDIE